MKRLKNIYSGQSVWIIGTGISLRYLANKDIGPGPVIAINAAIKQIERIDLPNPIFSMQKDGGIRKRTPGNLVCATRPISPDCDYTPHCGHVCGWIYRPQRGAVLLVHNRESLYCFPDYSPRYIFDWEGLGLSGNTCSLVMAIKIGQFMGCGKFMFVSCDVQVNGSIETYVPGIGIESHPAYIYQVEEVRPHLMGLDCGWITPVK